MRAVIVLALVVSISASAECKKEDFNHYVAAAVRLYEGLEYERAIDQILKAKEDSCGPHDDALLGLYEGIIRSDLGQADQAKSAFKEALLLEPDSELPLKVSPKTKKLVEVLRAEAKKELAPILARQEEERRKKVAEENARAEKARQEEEARRAADAKRAEELRIAQENAKNEEERRRLADEARRLEEDRRARERQLEQQRLAQADRPVQRELTPPPSQEPPPGLELKTRRGVPIVAIGFGAAALAAAGAATYFAVTWRQGVTAAQMTTGDQVERERLRNASSTNGIVADVLFGVAGAAAIGAVIGLIVNPSETVAEPAR